MTDHSASIHRLLDEAFDGIEMTPDARDLKEEIRANLVARVSDLEAAGRSSEAAAREAVAELGDVRDLLDGDGSTQSEWARNRVRPRPGFVVRTVLLSIVAAAALVLVVVGATGVLTIGLPALVALGAAVAVPLGVVTGDALTQETSTNHPMPGARAGGFGAATFGVLAAIALGGSFVAHPDAVWLVVTGALLLVVSVALFGWLGATQTNRHKAWVRRASPPMPANRFEREPETAARFGIYTVVIWLATFAVIAVLVFTVGWWWAPVAFAAGFGVMMLVLARMLFGAGHR